MRELAHDLPREALPGQELALAHDIALAYVVLEFEQHAVAGLQRRGAAVETELATRGARAQGAQPNGRAARHGTLAKLDELVRGGDDLAQAAPQGPALAQAEEVLRRQVEIGDDELLVERDDGNAQVAQDLVGLGPARAQSATAPGRYAGGREAA
jgi:hypothetical protein